MNTTPLTQIKDSYCRSTLFIVYLHLSVCQGKYAPDLEKLDQFYREMRRHCRVPSRQVSWDWWRLVT